MIISFSLVVLIHRTSEHFLTKPILHIEQSLALNDLSYLIRNEFTHFSLYVNILIEIKNTIAIHIVQVLLQLSLFTCKEAFIHKEPMSSEVVLRSCWNLMPTHFLIELRLWHSLKFQNILNRLFKCLPITLLPVHLDGIVLKTLISTKHWLEIKESPDLRIEAFESARQRVQRISLRFAFGLNYGIEAFVS